MEKSCMSLEVISIPSIDIQKFHSKNFSILATPYYYNKWTYFELGMTITGVFFN